MAGIQKAGPGVDSLAAFVGMRDVAFARTRVRLIWMSVGAAPAQLLHACGMLQHFGSACCLLAFTARTEPLLLTALRPRLPSCGTCSPRVAFASHSLGL